MNKTFPANSAADTWQTKEVIDTAKHDLQSRLSDVKESAKQTAQEVQAAAATTANVAREGYQALRHDAAAYTAGSCSELECKIRQEPLKSVGLAALGGLVVGLLLSK